MRIGIIGANGNMGFKRVTVLSETEHELILCDLKDSKIRAFEGRYKLTDDIDRVLKEDIDLLIISLMNGEMRDNVLLKSLDIGKNVLIEKPLTLDKAILYKAFDIAQKNNVYLKTAYNLDYFPSVQLMIENMELVGELNTITATYANGAFNPANNFVPHPGSDGAGKYMGCHILSILWHILPDSRFKNIYSFTTQKQQNFYDDTCIFTVEFDSFMFNALVSWTYWLNTFNFEVLGDDGLIRLEGLVKYIKYGQQGEKITFVKRKEGLPEVTERVFDYNNTDKLTADYELLNVEIEDFVSAIEKQTFDMKDEFLKNEFIYNVTHDF